MAEKIFLKHIEDAGLSEQVRVSSAGTDGWHAGDEADPRTNAVLCEHGYPTGHSAAKVSRDHLDADLVVPLDTGHDRILARLGVPTERRRLLRSFDPETDSDSVADPYYGPDSEFETVREQIEAAVPGLMDWVNDALGRR
ncbi:MAG: protein tyrosine phosphatase [Rhodococcus sp.]|nr:protein tyrosine phosphatase [Rhodococcus sp. (in: high G+C Gram-positive bacteria)]